MFVYLFNAALYCEPCGGALRAVKKLPAGGFICDESTWDSCDYPKGPYADGGGEADTPQHCDQCNEFLRNPLTADGLAYVRERIADSPPDSVARTTWADFYADELTEREDSGRMSQEWDPPGWMAAEMSKLAEREVEPAPAEGMLKALRDIAADLERGSAFCGPNILPDVITARERALAAIARWGA